MLIMLEQIKQNMKKEKIWIFQKESNESTKRRKEESGIIEMNRDVINNRLDTDEERIGKFKKSRLEFLKKLTQNMKWLGSQRIEWKCV